MRRWAVAAAAAASVGMMVGTPVAVAAGGTTRIVSATDPRGDAESKLDIVYEKFRGNGDGTATLLITTAESWGCRYLNGFGEDPSMTFFSYLFWEFDLGDDGTNDASGTFKCDQGRFRFELRHGGERNLDSVYPVTRPTTRSVRVTIPLAALRAKRFSLHAKSRVSGVDSGNVFVDEEDLTPRLKAY